MILNLHCIKQKNIVDIYQIGSKDIGKRKVSNLMIIDNIKIMMTKNRVKNYK